MFAYKRPQRPRLERFKPGHSVSRELSSIKPSPSPEPMSGSSELKASEAVVGQLYPVLKNKNGEIIDGAHRKAANPRWKTLTVPVAPGLPTLKLRIHSNLDRRVIPQEEKAQW